MKSNVHLQLNVHIDNLETRVNSVLVDFVEITEILMFFIIEITDLIWGGKLK